MSRSRFEFGRYNPAWGDVDLCGAASTGCGSTSTRFGFDQIWGGFGLIAEPFRPSSGQTWPRFSRACAWQRFGCCVSIWRPGLRSSGWSCESDAGVMRQYVAHASCHHGRATGCERLRKKGIAVGVRSRSGGGARHCVAQAPLLFRAVARSLAGRQPRLRPHQFALHI